MRISPVIPAIVAITIAAVHGCSLPLEGIATSGAGGSGGKASVTSAGGDPTTDTGTAMSSAAMSSAATSSTSTGAQCITKEECPPDGPCAAHECMQGQCVQTNLNERMTLADLDGNCAKTTCLSGVLTTQDDEGDSFDDGDECTIDGCENGSATHAPADEGSGCGGFDVCRNGICCPFAVTSCNGVCCNVLQKCTGMGCKPL